MKQREFLRFCRDEVKRSQKWRDHDKMDQLWKRMIDLYQGRQYDGKSPNDRLVVNLAFATKNVMAPSVAINNPRFTVQARKIENAPQAVIVEEVLNYIWRVYRYQSEFRLAVDDWLVVGHGWCKIGYKVVKPPEEKKSEDGASHPDDSGEDFGIDDREDVEHNVESELTVMDEDCPFVERISIFDVYVDPDARNPKEMRWIAQRTWRAVQDARVDERYSATARKKIAVSSYSRWTSEAQDGRAGDERPDKGAIGYCEIIEFYDLKRRIVCTFSLDNADAEAGDLFLIKPRPIPYPFGHPFVMLRNYEVPDRFYPLGELESIESLQLELNETRNQMLNHRKRFARKWVYQKDAFDKTGISALESDVDNVLVPVISDQPIDKVMAPVPAVGTPPDFYNQSELITNDIDRVSGVSDYQRGAQSEIRRTATEAAMIQDAANSRAQDKLSKIEDSLSLIGSRLIALMQQFMTGEHVARVVTMNGKIWINYDKDYLKGDFDFEVEAGSTEPRNESFRRQSALQMVDAMAPFVGQGVVDPQALARYVLQHGFGVKDTTSFIVTQPQQPPPGQEGEVPPGQEQMPPQGQLPPGPPQGQMPPDPFAGMQMPPEMMGQMPPEMMGAGQPPQGY